MLGIFLVPKLRVIFLKLIYNSIIGDIEDNLTNSNIGSRKNKSPLDHLFVVYSVLNETLKGKEPKDYVFYDIKECYDSLWVSRSLLDMYDNGVSTNLLNLLYELSRKASISIKTPVGITRTDEVEEIVMQGETISGIIVQID